MSQPDIAKELLNSSSKDKWQRITAQKRAGVLVPLFSIYSKESAGIADFSDLELLLDWVRATGNSILQLLPMNELGSVFCPYDSTSSFALEPAYLSFRKLIESGMKVPEDSIKELRRKFPLNLNYLNYSARKEKQKVLREIFLQNTQEPEDFFLFWEANSYWLVDFCLYKAIKEAEGERPWYEWSEGLRFSDPDALAEFHEKHKEEITFQAWLQWQLFKQFGEVKSAANSKGILLKGDLPILVSKDSADVWAHPEYFKLEFASGAPPDMYCAKGQRWGMPTYDWEKIVEDDYLYLIEKLKYAQNFYDILRIDHVVGLFRIWSIPVDEPLDNQGLNGFFDPRDEHLWGEHGRKILEVINKNTRMLLCAEDLGMIPRVCTDTLREMGVPGNDVQRWVKDWSNRHDFLVPIDYRKLSVAMLSTHDTTNWPAWWEFEAGTVDEGLFFRKCSDRRSIYFEKARGELFDQGRSHHGRLRWREEIDLVEKLVSILGKKKEEVGDFIDLYLNTYREKEKLWQQMGLIGPMREKCDKEISARALKISLNSSAIFCINTIFDLLYLDGGVFKLDPYACRINTPGTISDKNWSLLLPIPIEELVSHQVTGKISGMVAESGRS